MSQPTPAGEPVHDPRNDSVQDPDDEFENYDVLGEFPGAEDATDDTDVFQDKARVARWGVGTIVLMILAAFAFALGIAWGARQEFTVALGNVFWDIVIHVGFIVLCGLLAAAAVIAVAMLIVGIPFARGKMAETRERVRARRDAAR